MKRQSRRQLLRGSLALAGLGLLAGCGPVSLPGQSATRLRHIGYLDSDSRVTAGLFSAFGEGLRDLGYVEGQNLAIEYRDAEGDPGRLPALAAELVAAPVELLVAPNPIAAGAAARATATTPIVVVGGNLVGAGLVSNIARPEGNLTGVSTNNVETVGKWIELLKAAVPTISRPGVLLDPKGPSAAPVMQQVERSARALQLRPSSYELTDLDQLAAALSTARADGSDGLVLLSGGVLGSSSHPRIGGEVLRSRLPAVAEHRGFAVAGGLLAHGPDTAALARRAAGYVDKILKGARPGNLPVELPTTYTVVINLKSAEALGLTVPPPVLTQATEVIQ